jgi:hypothetical protein
MFLIRCDACRFSTRIIGRHSNIKRVSYPFRAVETSQHSRLPRAEILDNDVRTALSSLLPPADFVQGCVANAES